MVAMTFRETGSMNRTPTLERNKRKETDGLDESSPYIRKNKERYRFPFSWE